VTDSHTSRFAAPLQAELIQLEAVSVLPFDGGRAYGSAGPCELVLARAHVAVDPGAHPTSNREGR